MQRAVDPRPRETAADAAPAAAPRRVDGRLFWMATAGILGGAVFVADTLSGFESAIAVLYALVVVIGAQGQGRSVILGVSAVCSVLVVISFSATHLGDVDTGNIGRMVVSLVAIALTAALLSSRLTVQKTRLALQESEANLRAVADSVPQILWQALPYGRITYLSHRWTEMTGASVEEGLSKDGRGWLDWFHPEDRGPLLDDWGAAIAGEAAFESYRRLKVQDGSYRWLQISARPIRSEESGHVLRWYGVSTDIDAEMRAQLTIRDLNQTLEQRVAERTAELARSERRYRSAFEQSHVALFEMDISDARDRIFGLKDSGVESAAAYLFEHQDILEECLHSVRVLDANDAAVRLLGAERREELIAHEGTFMRDRSRETVDLYCALVEHNQRVEGASEVMASNGKIVKVLFGTSRIDAPDDRFHILVGMIDVTERERAQELLLAAQEELARANRAATLGALSASIAHELNQPIGAVMMDAQTAARWLERDPPDLESARRALSRVAGNAERASGILRRTREQLIKGRRVVGALDVADVVSSSLSLLEREIRVGRTRVHLRVADGLPPIEADRIELQQVMVNLVVNAVQAMRQSPAGQRILDITVDADGEDKVRVRVSDTGTGIDQEHIDRLFEPFFTTKPEGMGMGLQICRATIQSFGGDMSARNNEGKGATFEFVLPAAGGEDA
ncbi:hypothetical protein DLJ53_01680 [Acuticoccus sediminis]|uniref:histidine kinase n=1 Tax=Acuticoccus sediminis TaxID=2184697 RepID=A0A8B2NSS5_9HYPH|nr:ATP-binding protein [Acuticoccus sediminis]RAI03258.1 hypothetical protein DLJ53_01680 [Acuticoccus sediminis]